ncbi:HepT-like ribonuclease domain-containing protein [Nesterenkonia marinintestina]|uniref:HepT-like ribonuclease domain-containing protein n=1 Tax=Nesterenkonia marinintestina TaxID=2979865 RepID=UPI0021BECEE2|nr:HepT-like ribonuclease domain-containing protein [Nesterenkonia sp. GX14115]
MTRHVEQRISDVLEAIERCRWYVGLIEAADESDLVDMAEDAIERNLQIIGETWNHLPPAITDAHPETAWAQIRGFRSILNHKYFDVDIEIIRKDVEVHLPPLAEGLAQHLQPPPSDTTA